MKLPAHRARLRRKVISFYIVFLDPAYPARGGRRGCRARSGQAQDLPGIKREPLNVTYKECGCVQELVYALCRALWISA